MNLCKEISLIRKTISSKDKSCQPFPKIRDKATTEALTEKQWTLFIATLKGMSQRDYLVAKMLLQGGKRLDEVLSATIEKINWTKRQIVFKQSKADTMEKVTIITYPADFLEELKDYIGSRKKGLIFLSKKGNKLTQPHIYRSFVSASKKADLPIKVTAHSLRASCITFLTQRGFTTDQILKVSGHCDSRYVIYYDKSEIENNVSREVSLI